MPLAVQKYIRHVLSLSLKLRAPSEEQEKQLLNFLINPVAEVMSCICEKEYSYCVSEKPSASWKVAIVRTSVLSPGTLRS